MAGLSFFQHESHEFFYHTIVQTCLAFGGAKVQGERSGAMGRSDIIAECPGERYLIIEVKYLKSEEKHTEADIEQKLAEASEEALKQIVETDYAGPLRLLAKEILGLSLCIYGRKDVRSDFVTEDLLKPQPVR
ncbi:MAG: PD-(D/E)XK nuclease domain-containing protein [Deltaproteobacteria bacterium]|nr:PD-(D/E)XK nuclease domain-containing protein [Deltaproteobacteria bacterium]